MANLDIVKIINNTTLSEKFNTKMLDKVKKTFTNDQQQLFISSFYCYINHNSKTEFVITLESIWKWCGFTRQDNAKVVLKKNFVLDIDYKIILLRLQENLKGGRPKEDILMTVNTFKKFCLKANTKKADEIHDYYIKLEELLQETMFEESAELKVELQQKVKELEDNKPLEKHNMLLREYGNIGNIVYVIKVKSLENNKFIIRVGTSIRGVEKRFQEHRQKYDECLIMDCFLVNKNKDFELFLHNQIKESKVTNLVGHETDNELFLVGEKLSYNTLLNIINTNIKHFNHTTLDLQKAELEIERLKQMNELSNNDTFKNIFDQFLEINKNLLNKMNDLENQNKVILEKINSLNTKTTNNFQEPLATLGGRLQKINPDTLQLIKVYETVNECLKEDYTITRPSLNKAVVENTIYNGFRWLLVDRELNPNIIHIIQPTKVTKIQDLGFIAKLNLDKTEILNVYLDRKTASTLNNYPSDGSLDNSVKNFSLTNGNYYTLYSKCDIELRNKFENIHGKVLLYKNGVGQFNDNILIKEFSCKNDCCKILGISDKTIKKSIEKNVKYNGFYYKYLSAKLQMIL